MGHATWEESEQGRSQFDAFYTLLGRDEVGQQPLDTSKAESTDGPDRYILQDACSIPSTPVVSFLGGRRRRPAIC